MGHNTRTVQSSGWVSACLAPAAQSLSRSFSGNRFGNVYIHRYLESCSDFFHAKTTSDHCPVVFTDRKLPRWLRVFCSSIRVCLCVCVCGGLWPARRRTDLVDAKDHIPIEIRMRFNASHCGRRQRPATRIQTFSTVFISRLVRAGLKRVVCRAFS